MTEITVSMPDPEDEWQPEDEPSEVSLPSDPLIDGLLQSQMESPNLDTFSSSLLAEFGGMAGLSRELRIEYESSKPGSTNRGYILRSIVDLVKAAVLKKGATNPLAGVTVEEMKAAMKRLSGEDRPKLE